MKILRIVFILFSIVSVSCQNNSSNNISEKAKGNNEEALFEEIFNKYKTQIEGPERTCWVVKGFIDDINQDNLKDVVIFWGCGPKEGGNAFAGSGLAFFLKKNEDYVFNGTFEDSVDFVPQKIEAGIIWGEIQKYAEDDARCCPSIKIPIKFKYQNNTVIKID